jgi:hypothetical protein
MRCVTVSKITIFSSHISVAQHKKTIIICVIALMAIAPLAFCQSLNLRLDQIGEINLPDSITNLYTADLNGDSIREIIMTTATNVYVYNPSTYQQIWSSPPLIRPNALKFADMNNDEFKDIALVDSLNIIIYDIHNSAIIWTSLLPAGFRLYNIGDRNNDGLNDIILVRLTDTAWVDFYNAPSFQYNQYLMITMDNSYGFNQETGESWGTEEYPSSISLENIGDSEGTIVVFTSTYSWAMMSWYGHHSFSGSIYLIGAQDSSTTYINDIGRIVTLNIINIDNQAYLFPITEKYGCQYADLSPTYYWRDKYIMQISSSNIISSQSIWDTSQQDRDWQGFLQGEISIATAGDEICVADLDSLKLYSYPILTLHWSIGDIDSPTSPFAIYHSNNLFSGPQIMYGNLDRLYNGTNGELSATISSDGVSASAVVDLNNDGNDEILSLQNSSLRIYNLFYENAIGDQALAPKGYSLSQNYPNPFNAQTVIRYSLLGQSLVSIDVFDILGRKIETLDERMEPAGEHHLIWDASGQSSGIYFYRIKAGDKVETKKMILLK